MSDTEQRPTPPKPTTVTWCRECNRIGERRDFEAVEEHCRYCGARESVMVRRYPGRNAARRAIEAHRQARPVVKGGAE